MAVAPIEVTLPGMTGATLTLTLFPHGSDTAAVSGLSLTEATNRKCTYTTTTTAALTGLHLAVVKESTSTVGEGYVQMDDSTSNHVVASQPWIGNIDATRVKIESGGSKNTALSNFKFVMVSSVTGLPLAGLTVTATRSIDGGAHAASTNAPTGIGNGEYAINMSAADRNGNFVMWRFTATGAKDLYIGMPLT